MVRAPTSSSPGHTPAPWRFGKRPGQPSRPRVMRLGNLYAVAPGRKNGARTVVLSIGFAGPNDAWIQVARADARLIEAAPEMADALIEVDAEIRRLNEAAGETLFNPAATDLVRAALKQAGVRA